MEEMCEVMDRIKSAIEYVKKESQTEGKVQREVIKHCEVVLIKLLEDINIFIEYSILTWEEE